MFLTECNLAQTSTTNWELKQHVFATGSKTVRVVVRAHFRKLGWGVVGIIPTVSMATLHDLHLHFMLRYLIFASAGEFQRTERFRNRALSVHTGTIDSCWKQMKTNIPKSLRLSVKTDTFAYLQLAMEIHTC